MGLESILKFSGKSYGGVRCNQVEAIVARATTSMPDYFNQGWAAGITTSSDWYALVGRKNTVHFTEDLVIIDGSQYYQQQMKISFTKDSGDLIYKLRKMSRLGLMIRWRDENGVIKLLGTCDQPARFTWGRDNKNVKNQVNVNEGLISCTSRLPVLLYPVAAG